MKTKEEAAYRLKDGEVAMQICLESRPWWLLKLFKVQKIHSYRKMCSRDDAREKAQLIYEMMGGDTGTVDIILISCNDYGFNYDKYCRPGSSWTIQEEATTPIRWG